MSPRGDTCVIDGQERRKQIMLRKATVIWSTDWFQMESGESQCRIAT